MKLFWQLYLEKINTKTVSLKKFFFRRILRILPLYILILSFGLIYYNFLLPKLGFPFNSNYNIYEGLLLSMFFMPNVFAILYSPGSIIEVLWSIGVEEQFYIFIAPVMLFLPVKKIISFLLIFTIIFFLIFFNEQTLLFRKFGMYFFYFTCSGIFSIMTLKYNFSNIYKSVKYLFLIIFMLYFTSNFFINYFSNEIYHFFSMILFPIAISLVSISSIKLLDTKLLNYLGKISYGIYMYHSIVIQFIGLLCIKILNQIYVNQSIVIIFYNFLVITITIAISHLSYQYYELYFIKKKTH